MHNPVVAAREPGVAVSGLVKRFGPVAAVDGVSLTVADGELVAVVGPSGCGKTTLLRLIAGLEQPDAGRVFIHGRDVSALPPERRDVGFVFQQFALFPNMSVAGNVEYGLKRRGVPRAERARRVQEMLAMVGLSELAGRRPDQLSAGQQQRVALARALAPRPKTLLLDEPLSALDAAIRVRLREELRETQRRLGITTILVTHDQEEALAIADRVAVMNAGRLEQIGTPWELYDRPQTAFVAGFIGRGNFLTVRVAGDVLDCGPFGRVPKAALAEAAGLPDGSFRALVRPEAVWLQLVEDETGIGSSPLTVQHLPPAPAAVGPSGRPAPGTGSPQPAAVLAAPAVIVDVIFGGERSLVKLQVEGSPWIAAVFGAAAQTAAQHVGRRVRLLVPVAALRLLPPA
ncbi:MAG TPA: ATP-binding cassette domain-containing protein [Limnochordales bacterium]